MRKLNKKENKLIKEYMNYKINREELYKKIGLFSTIISNYCNKLNK